MIPELVAPAGDFDALKAAVLNGADAVYLGGKRFNARIHAKNFTLKELQRAIRYSHGQNVKVYVTVNTLIADRELSKLVEYLTYLYHLDVDAVIIQDLGVFKLCKELIPNLKVHASTQTTVYNAAGVKFLTEHGAKRVILARELSLPEIIKIKQECNVELEVFVHGALCFSVSGQCLMSSFLGGRSANRGRCASPCRLPYSIVDMNEIPILTKGPYILSMKDLNLSEDINKLTSAEIDAFKIEGRMKIPEYVAIVTRIYRKIIDDQRTPTVIEKKNLAAIFNREFTKGYIDNPLSCEIINCERPGNHGIEVGIVTGYDTKLKTVSILLSDDIHVGDGLGFKTSTGINGIIINKLLVNGRKTNRAFTKCIAYIFLPFHPVLKSTVRKTRDSVLHAQARATFGLPVQIRTVTVKNSSMLSNEKKSDYNKLVEILSISKNKQISKIPKICAEVSTFAALEEAFHANVNEVYFGGFGLSGDLDTHKQALNFAKEKGIPFAIVLPRIVRDEEHLKSKILELVDAGAYTFLVGDIGVLRLVRHMGLTAYLDSSFNIFNRPTRNLLFDYAPRITLSQELHLSQIGRIAGGAAGEVEYIVHGPITLMLSRHCPISNSLFQGDKSACKKICNSNEFFLKDEKGSLFSIRCDNISNIHISYPKDICLIDHMPELRDSGINVFRIRCQNYSPNMVGELIKCYSKALFINRNDPRERELLKPLREKIQDLSRKEISEGRLLKGVE